MTPHKTEPHKTEVGKNMIGNQSPTGCEVAMAKKKCG